MIKAALAVVLLGVLAGEARAGDCPSCDEASDCPGGFCVRHEAEVGCGATLDLCCPGQACALGDDGRPSCEGTGTCTVIGEAIDAGPVDAGGLPDGRPLSDAGVEGGGATDDGCGGCGAAGLTSGGLVAALGLAFLARRRR